ncbi:hypothetical protein A3K63_00605 [Candidatus Micrarchaeota archaeon RBG_16_49_10]|nr:MAG: hypothetical protein A3K63_00605 [Candidatus Micrarchaeota archaeon RBG_16_49_10]
MIFATVGTSKHDFSRMVKTIDELSKKVEEMVLIQIGHSKHIPQNAMYVKFLNPVDFEKTIKKARVVIISGGSSSLFKCVDNGKKPIIFPRLKKYGEHIDNHQVQLGKGVSKEGLAFVANNLEELEGCLKSKNFSIVYKKQRSPIYDEIKKFIENL